MQLQYQHHLQQPLQQVHNQIKKLKNQLIWLEVFLEIRKKRNLRKLILQKMKDRRLNNNQKQSTNHRLSKPLLILKQKPILANQRSKNKKNQQKNQNKRIQRRRVRMLREKIRSQGKNKDRNKVVETYTIQRRKIPTNRNRRYRRRRNKKRKKLKNNPKPNKTHKLTKKAKSPPLNPNKTINNPNPNK